MEKNILEFLYYFKGFRGFANYLNQTWEDIIWFPNGVSLSLESFCFSE